MILERSISEISVELGLISRDDLVAILAARTDTTEPIGDLLVRLGKITTKQKVMCEAQQMGVPFIDFVNTDLDPATVRSISHALALKLKAVVLERTDVAASVAMVDPLDLNAIDALEAATGLEIDALLATAEDIADAIYRIFGPYDDLADLVRDAGATTEQDLIEGREGRAAGPVVLDLKQSGDTPPIIKLTNAIMSKAIAMRASDIHIEPQTRQVRVRLRIDGLLQEIMTVPKDLQQMLVSRIKILAGLDIAERRVPQDGRCSLVSGHLEYDFRVSTYPSVHGETVVMRILDKQSAAIDLQRLGINAGVMKRYLPALNEPQGLILVTGPTGSGKTTTLYASVHHLNTQHRNIITIEDPVEYQLEGITQANINPRAGVTFATGLRAILRQDPDVILVGEVRDGETAGIAIEAALTGHLVLTSLHANDSVGALSRLMDMGVEPFLLASSISASVAQRLVRLNCRACLETYMPDPVLLNRLGLPLDREYQRGHGCEACAKTGFRGRTGVYEVLTMSSEIRKMLLTGVDSVSLKQMALRQGMTVLRTDALDKVLAGQTTPEEVIRVTAEN